MTPLPEFALRLADGPEDVRIAQRLRYSVFIDELGGDGDMVDHAAGLERDRFDHHCDHLILDDLARPAHDRCVGTYRVMRQSGAEAAGGFYTEGEFDIALLRQRDASLLELGRSCLHPEYRGGTAMLHLWGGLADYVARHGIQILFGTASFHGTDVGALAPPLSMLHHRHLAPGHLRPRALDRYYQPMDLCHPEKIDRIAAMRAVPALIKAYLRLGGFVGDGAYIDHDFNTVDVCLVMDTDRLTPSRARLYAGG